MDTSAFVKKARGQPRPRRRRAQGQPMTPQEIKALQEKATSARRSSSPQAKIDSLETEKAALEGQVQNLTKELETAKAATRADAAEDPKKFQARVDAQVELVRQAARATGAKVDAKMTAARDHAPVIKHVDGDDVPADKHDQYVHGRVRGRPEAREDRRGRTTRPGSARLDARRGRVPQAPAGADPTSGLEGRPCRAEPTPMNHQGRGRRQDARSAAVAADQPSSKRHGVVMGAGVQTSYTRGPRRGLRGHARG
jgi:hypothetical protein